MAARCPTVGRVAAHKAGRVTRVMRVAANLAEMSIERLAGLSRRHSVAHRRQECMAALRAAGMGYPLIGRCMERDHTTILEGAARATERATANPCVAARIAILTAVAR